MMRSLSLTLLSTLLLAVACGDGGGNEADRAGVGAECAAAENCALYKVDGGDAHLSCLGFKGGYCGLQGCVTSANCPQGSICVHHTDGNDYCFRSCLDKTECNRNRTPANEANCSSSFDWATPSEDNGSKACIPPSST